MLKLLKFFSENDVAYKEWRLSWLALIAILSCFAPMAQGAITGTGNCAGIPSTISSNYSCTGDVTIGSGSTLTLNGDITLSVGGTLTVGGTIVVHPASTFVTISAGTLTNSGTITTSGYGYAAASGPGAGGNDDGFGGGGGGGYGGDGSNGTYDQVTPSGGTGGGTYSNLNLSTIFMGSGGGNGASGEVGGTGGGALKFVVSGTFTNNGGISADGGTGQDGESGDYSGGGGGSGGSVYISVGTWTGNGIVSAFGGPGGTEPGDNSFSGNGGGGRIYVGYNIANAYSGSYFVAGGSNGGSFDGGTGTIRVLNASAGITTLGNGVNPANKTAARQSTNTAVDVFTLSRSGGTTTPNLTGLTVTFSGAAVTDVAANGVKIWQDNNGNSEYDTGELQIGSAASFSCTSTSTPVCTATFTGLSVAITPTETQYLITYDIDANAVPNHTLSGRVTAATVTNVLDNDVTNDTAGSTLTVAGGATTTIGDGNNNICGILTGYPITVVGPCDSQADQPIAPGDTNKAVDAFTLSTSTGIDTLTALTVTFSGTTAADVAANGVKIWKDNNGNSNYDVGDTPIGIASFSGNTATFSNLAIGVTTTSTQYLITYDIAANAASDHTTHTLLGRVSAATVGRLLVNQDTTDATLILGRATILGNSVRPADKFVGQGTIAATSPSLQNTAVDAFTLSTNGGTDTLTALNVVFSGTNAADVQANGVKLWSDDGTVIGELDAGDHQIGSGVSLTLTSGTYVATFNESPGLTITTTPTPYLITYDIAPAATIGDTLSALGRSATVGNTLVNTHSTHATLTVSNVAGTSYPPSAFIVTDPAYVTYPLAGDPSLAGNHIYTKLAGTGFSLNIAAVSSGGHSVNTAYSGRVVTALYDNSLGKCPVNAPNTCACAISSLGLIGNGGGFNETLVTPTTTAGHLGQWKPSFSPTGAYKSLIVVMRECSGNINTNTGCPSGYTNVVACSADGFSVRPTSLTAVATDADSQTAGTTRTLNNTSPSTGVKHQVNQPFTLTVNTNATCLLGSFNYSYPGSSDYFCPAEIKIDNTAKQAVSGTLGTLTAAFPLVPIATSAGYDYYNYTNLPYTTTTATYDSVGAFRLRGYNPATDATSPRGVYDNTWTAVDSANGDCIVNSYSNSLSGGKYGCNYGLTADVTLGYFVGDHLKVDTTRSALVTRADLPLTTGTIASASSTLAVAAATGISVGNNLLVLGAGPGGTALQASVSAIAGTNMTLSSSASTNANATNIYNLSTQDSFTYMGEPMLLQLAVQAYGVCSNGTEVPVPGYNSDGSKLSAASITNTNWFNTGCAAGTQCMGLGGVYGSGLGASDKLVIDTSIVNSSSGSNNTAATDCLGNAVTATTTFFTLGLKVARPNPDPTTGAASNATWGPYDNLKIGVMPLASDGLTVPGPNTPLIDPVTSLANPAYNDKVDFDATTGNTLASGPDGTNERRQICINSLQVSGCNSTDVTRVRMGRIKLPNAHGSELLPLTIAAIAQYWDGTSYATNTLDNKSPFVATDLTFGNRLKNILLNLPAYPNTASIVFSSNIFSSSGSSPDTITYRLPVPGANNNGSVDMSIPVPANCNVIPEPLGCYLPSNTARATFGVYKGASELIDLRENY